MGKRTQKKFNYWNRKCVAKEVFGVFFKIKMRLRKRVRPQNSSMHKKGKTSKQTSKAR